MLVILVAVAILLVAGLGGWRLRAAKEQPVMLGSAIIVLGLRAGERHGHVWDAVVDNHPVVVATTSDKFLVWGPSQGAPAPRRIALADLPTMSQRPDPELAGGAIVTVSDGSTSVEFRMAAGHASALIATATDQRRRHER